MKLREWVVGGLAVVGVLCYLAFWVALGLLLLLALYKYVFGA